MAVACRTIPVTYVLGVDDPITCVLPIARTLTARWTIAGPVLHVIVSHGIIRAYSCRPRAAVRRQRQSLRSSRQRARKLHGSSTGGSRIRYKKSGCRTTTRPSDRPGTDDDRLGSEIGRRTPERRRLVRTPKWPVQNDGEGS